MKLETKIKILRWVRELLKLPPDQSISEYNLRAFRALQVIRVDRIFPNEIELEDIKKLMAKEIAAAVCKDELYEIQVIPVPMLTPVAGHIPLYGSCRFIYTIQVLVPIQKQIKNESNEKV